jgi:hypothetical protein
MSASIQCNSTKLANAAALANKVETFVANGGVIKTSRRNLNRKVSRPGVAVVTEVKPKYNWAAAMEELRALGKLTPELERLIKARI